MEKGIGCEELPNSPAAVQEIPQRLMLGENSCSV